MMSKYAADKLKRELIEAYRRDYNDDTPTISWSDALCKDFATHIGDAIKPMFSDDEIVRQEYKVSETTVQRIVSNQFEIRDELHWTTRRVLNNLCIYLGYSNWNEFFNSRLKTLGYLSEEGFNGPDQMTAVQNERYAYYMTLIKEAKEAEFDVYKQLPKENFDLLKKYYDEEGVEFQRIARPASIMNEEGLSLLRKKHNSGFSIDSFVLVDTGEIFCACTTEHWRMKWYETITYKFKYYFDLITIQLIAFTDEDKIYSIEYKPVCERDSSYVQSVYGDARLGLDDMVDIKF